MDTMKDFVNNRVEGRARARQPYYYIWCILHGKLYVDGAYKTREEALHFGANKIKNYFEVEEICTKDLSVATQFVKHKRLESCQNIEEATQRAAHKQVPKDR